MDIESMNAGEIFQVLKGRTAEGVRHLSSHGGDKNYSVSIDGEPLLLGNGRVSILVLVEP